MQTTMQQKAGRVAQRQVASRAAPVVPRLGRARLAVRAQAAATAAVSRELQDKCVNTIRFLAIDAVNKSKSGHPGMPMGCAPMGFVLWNEVMKYNPKNPEWVNRDRFVLSAGHGSMFQYAMLHLAGYDSVSVSGRVAPITSGGSMQGARCNIQAQGVGCWRPNLIRHTSLITAEHASAPLGTPRPADGRHQVVQAVGLSDPRPPRELHHQGRGGHHWYAAQPTCTVSRHQRRSSSTRSTWKAGWRIALTRTPIPLCAGPLGTGICNAVGLAVAEAHLAARFNKPDAPKIIDHYT